MKLFSERNPVAVAAVGIVVVFGSVLTALQFNKLPFIHADTDYSAYFLEAGGLAAGAEVQVNGYAAGRVSAVSLDNSRVLVDFTVDDTFRLGDRTEAAIKTNSLLGTKILEVTPRGHDAQRETIPLDRTISPYQLPDALGDLATTISGLNTDQLSESLTTLAQTFSATPPELSAAITGVARFSDAINQRDGELRDLLANASKVTGVLAERSNAIADLVRDTNELLDALHAQSTALDQISGNVTALARQLSAFITDNRTTLKPALDKLNEVLTILDNRKERISKTLKLLNGYVLSLGESVGSGPFFKAYIANLLPGQFVQPFIDAAFSDLGLDPAVLLPSELADPPVGQPGTPPLPAPYPRTGQGGEPKLTLPDAITGNPGDPRYPYREPLPAPPPGGPPPGPPALAPPGLAGTTEPTPSPVLVPAPNEVVTPPSEGAP